MSKETFKVDKNGDFSNWFNRIIREAQLIDDRYNVKGFIVHRPWSMTMLKQIYRLYENELEERGHRPVLFPTVIPEESLSKEEEHVEGFRAEVFWITHGGDDELEKRLALRPTSETAFYPLYSLWIRSVSDLPLKLYQSCSVFRYETKSTKPLIRGREFLWIEAHDVFATEKEAYKQVEEDMEIAEEVIHRRLGIPFIFLERPQWDKFRGAVKTFAADCIMPDGKLLQIASTHYLGQRFSKAFEITFLDSDGTRKYAYQTCYGPGIWRILAAVISIHGDDNGLIVPFEIAPIQVIIVPIFAKEHKEPVEKYCMEVYRSLKAAGFRVEADFSDKTPGAKYYYWEMMGVPIRAEVGIREVEAKSVTLFRRDDRSRIVVQLDGLVEAVRRLGDESLQNLRKRAEEFLQLRIFKATTFDEVKDLADRGGFIIAPFCSIDFDGESCSIKLKEVLGLEVRGVPLKNRVKPSEGEKCIVCGREAGEYVYLGKAY